MVRTYTPADHDALVDLFARVGADSPSGDLWKHLPSERMAYLDPYIEHCPDTLFLAEAGGDLVGYLTGCPDSALLPGEDERLTKAIIRHKVMIRPRSLPFFARSLFDVVRAKVRGVEVASGESVDQRWPAHPRRESWLPPADLGREHPGHAVLREVRIHSARLDAVGAWRSISGRACSSADHDLVSLAAGLNA